jgi:hypothetical protein
MNVPTDDDRVIARAARGSIQSAGGESLLRLLAEAAQGGRLFAELRSAVRTFAAPGGQGRKPEGMYSTDPRVEELAWTLFQEADGTPAHWPRDRQMYEVPAAAELKRRDAATLSMRARWMKTYDALPVYLRERQEAIWRDLGVVRPDREDIDAAVAAEREACAKVAGAAKLRADAALLSSGPPLRADVLAAAISAAIRARDEVKPAPALCGKPCPPDMPHAGEPCDGEPGHAPPHRVRPTDSNQIESSWYDYAADAATLRSCARPELATTEEGAARIGAAMWRYARRDGGPGPGLCHCGLAADVLGRRRVGNR